MIELGNWRIYKASENIDLRQERINVSGAENFRMVDNEINA